jgi:hypothetical protein
VSCLAPLVLAAAPDLLPPSSPELPPSVDAFPQPALARATIMTVLASFHSLRLMLFSVRRVYGKLIRGHGMVGYFCSSVVGEIGVLDGPPRTLRTVSCRRPPAARL